MHLNFSFSAVQIIWALTFAALLVLLVVLLGRDRVRRFPWFTASIVLTALRLLASRLLFGRLASITMSEILIGLADLGLIVGLLVLVEIARRAFVGLGRRAWLVGTLAVLAVGGVVLYFWGPWPAWKSLDQGFLLRTLQLMELSAQKGDMLLGVLAIELGLLIALLGKRFHAGWRSHPQRLAIGLSTAAIGQLAVQGIWQLIAARTALHSRADYEHVLDLRDKLFNANGVVYVLVLVWWVVSLWADESGAASGADSSTDSAQEPVADLT